MEFCCMKMGEPRNNWITHAARFLGAMFPLTPTLSLREKLLRRSKTPDALRNVTAHALLLPLPEGEGWGEGEASVRKNKAAEFCNCLRNLVSGLVFLALPVCFVPPPPAADTPAKPRTLIAVLQSDSSLFEKARACQQLGEVGTPEAVSVLATLLVDEHLSAYARSGLEGIPDPGAAAALREAAPKLKGPLLAGVVNSLGVLRDPEAVGLLRQFATDPASGVATEALLALGNISTPESIQV